MIFVHLFMVIFLLGICFGQDGCDNETVPFYLTCMSPDGNSCSHSAILPSLESNCQNSKFYNRIYGKVFSKKNRGYVLYFQIFFENICFICFILLNTPKSDNQK